MKLFIMFLLCFLGEVSPGEVHKKPLSVSIYYESYCGDCVDFINKQLTPSFNKFKGQVNIDLVPYGNAEQKYVDGHWVFRCQHGPRECLANKLHACIILQACGEGGTVSCHVDNVSHVVNYLDCVTKETDQLEATKKCAEKEGLKSQEIVKCALNETGDRLLNLYGNKTIAFRPHIEYVPYVAVDRKHNKNAEQNLTAEICKLRPRLCQ